MSAIALIRKKLPFLLDLTAEERRFHKTVTIEKLATVFPQPTLFESHRCSIQRFLLLPQMSIKLLWFLILKR